MLQPLDRDAHLAHPVTFADGHRVVLQTLEVHGDRQRGTDLILAPVAPPDRLGLVVVGAVVAAQPVLGVEIIVLSRFQVEWRDFTAADRTTIRELFEAAYQRLYSRAILAALAAPPYALDAEHGLGVVVPHRAQRAALQQNVPSLNLVDALTGRTLRSAVDTVERFQGDERVAILVSATESDPQYLLVSGDFLLDPRRLTVALSRAKRKMILVASRSVFSVFSADEETFANAQLWKNLLRATCTQLLWDGEHSGKRVEVWGNVRAH